MRKAVLRCAAALADRAEKQIRAAGRTVPDREFLLAAVMPAAKSAAASARFLERSLQQLQVAEKWAVRAAETALAAADRTAAVWIDAAATDIEQAVLTAAEEADFAGITAALQAPAEKAGSAQNAEPGPGRAGEAE